VENLVRCFSQAYFGKKVLVTGHTGFKGSWLCLWLRSMGAHPIGLSLAPSNNLNHWDQLELPIESHIVDIRDLNAVVNVFRNSEAEIVFHLAAQPLVRRSYVDPPYTWDVNVVGTSNVLSACASVPTIKAIVAITTDKVYENREWVWGYRENDTLGGFDPYSASKAASELVIASYRKSFFSDCRLLLASARAGNVIGGGDWSDDRLIPDLVRAVSDKKSLEIRYPNATRPWQHVLDCLSGYLLLGKALLDRQTMCADAWNFGPDKDGNRAVLDVLSIMKKNWPSVSWHQSPQQHPHEANLLYLDSSKARDLLGWRPVLTFDQAAEWTVDWYRDFVEGKGCRSEIQLDAYFQKALKEKVVWAADK
jgi:CDP-glucose 4,6-dehydratase